MKKETFDLVKKEMIYTLIVFFIAIAIFKIAFFKESFIVVLRMVLSLFWIFVLPGYFMMLYWRENLEFMERLVIGIVISAALAGILSYYLGLIGLNIKYHAVLLPPILILAGILASLRK